MTEKLVDVWITKSALVSGAIWRVRAEVTALGCANVAGGGTVGPGDWHLTEREALARVAKLAAAKRKSLAKAVARLDEVDKILQAGTFKIIDLEEES